MLSPSGMNNEITLAVGENRTFTCSTDACRPASLIKWYIGGNNKTNLAKTSITTAVSDNTTYISTSTLVYTGSYDDHFQYVYCETANIDGMQAIRSSHIALLIKGKCLWVTIFHNLPK